jgi:hypothetical protein
MPPDGPRGRGGPGGPGGPPKDPAQDDKNREQGLQEIKAVLTGVQWEAWGNLTGAPFAGSLNFGRTGPRH